jgi:hypothetical protein
MNREEWASNWEEFGDSRTLDEIVLEYHEAEAKRMGLGMPLEPEATEPWCEAWRIALAVIAVVASIAVVGRALWWLGEYTVTLARVAWGLW